MRLMLEFDDDMMTTSPQLLAYLSDEVGSGGAIIKEKSSVAFDTTFVGASNKYSHCHYLIIKQDHSNKSISIYDNHSTVIGYHIIIYQTIGKDNGLIY